jgi:hypothetical protein
MQQELLPSLIAFRNKCSPGLFDSVHFTTKNDGLGFTKETALARVAVWSAIHDVFQLSHCLTPGQVATIVDASPIIAGPESMACFSKVRHLAELDSAVRAQNPKWVLGIVAYSQLWSIARAANVDLPGDYLLNSKVQDEHYPQAALLSAAVAGGVHTKLCPQALNNALSLGSSFCQAVPENLQEAARNGDWGFLRSTAQSQDLAFLLEQSLPPVDPTLRQGRGPFLGPASLGELYSLCRAPSSKTHSTRELLSQTPFGLHAMIAAKRFTGMTPDDDIMGAAIQGVHRAWDTYSPIVIPKQTINQTKAQFIGDGSIEQGELGFDGKKYQGTRLQTSVEVWVRKHVQEARAENHGPTGIPRSIRPLLTKLKKRAAEISNADEIPFEDALIVASEEMEIDQLKKKTQHPDYAMRLNQAREMLLGRGQTVRLDMQPDSGRSRHEMIAQEEPDTSQAILDAHSDLIIAPGKVPLPYPQSYTDRFDALYNFARAVERNAADALLHLAAGTKNISLPEVQLIGETIRRYAENPDVSRPYTKTLETLHSLLSDANYPTEPMFAIKDVKQLCATNEKVRDLSIGAQIHEQLRVAARSKLDGTSSQQSL